MRGADVREWMTIAEGSGRSAIVRNIQVGPAAEPLWLVLGFKTKDGSMSRLPRQPAPAVLESIAGERRIRRASCGR